MGTAVTTVAALGLAHIDGVVSSRDVGLSVVPQLCHIRSNEHDLRGVPTVWLCAPVDVGGAGGVWDDTGGSGTHCEVSTGVCGACGGQEESGMRDALVED